jgi:hypothetical protein
MAHVPRTASDQELIRFIDRWAELLEREDYVAAFALTEHIPEMNWSPDLIRYVIKAYGNSHPDQKVTLAGQPTDVTQNKDVTRWKPSRHGAIAEIWYDLNIDGHVTDLTATFHVFEAKDGLVIKLNDIHVM